MKKIKLYIDSSDNKKTRVSVAIDGKKSYREESLSYASQNVLKLVREILRDNSVKPSQISSIFVNKGPGSFTGLRVGISVANTLGYFLNIPLNGEKAGVLVVPQYSP